MTELRQRMLDAMILRGYAQRTQEAYLGAVALLARHYKVRPDALSEQQVQQYLLHLHVDLKRSASTVNQYGSAFRFFYGDVLGLQAQAFQIPMAAAPVRLPEILSREEISRLLAAARSPAAYAFLALAYSSGLRLSQRRLGRPAAALRQLRPHALAVPLLPPPRLPAIAYFGERDR